MSKSICGAACTNCGYGKKISVRAVWNPADAPSENDVLFILHRLASFLFIFFK